MLWRQKSGTDTKSNKESLLQQSAEAAVNSEKMLLGVEVRRNSCM